MSIEEILADPSVSFWLKDALRSALDRDPVDAWKDTDLLTVILRERVDFLLLDDLGGQDD